ncbi:MAG: S8 family serine peptidase [Bacteroidota bacterium]
MKNRILWALVALVGIVMLNCEPQKNVIEIVEGVQEHKERLRLSDNQLIVRIPINTPDDTISRLKTTVGIDTAEMCSCGDTRIQRWTIADTLNIEDAIRNLKRQGGSSGVEGDRDFIASMERIPDFKPFDRPISQVDGLVGRKESAEITIAVMDTGLDIGQYQDTSGSFSIELFPSGEYSGCYGSNLGSISGWNFVDNSPEIKDDHGHGTYVTKIITDELDKLMVKYQILPLKVFNGSGEGSYWDMICAMAYLKDIVKNGGVIPILNTSFGGYVASKDFQESSILKAMLKEMEESVLVVASAGNSGLDTDNGSDSHFLSSYTAPNLMGVGGHNGKDEAMAVEIDSLSNYGKISIDITVPFRGYATSALNLAGGTNSLSLAGTSYSAAYVSALTAVTYLNNGRPSALTLKSLVLGSAVTAPNLDGEIVNARAIIKP